MRVFDKEIDNIVLTALLGIQQHAEETGQDPVSCYCLFFATMQAAESLILKNLRDTEGYRLTKAAFVHLHENKGANAVQVIDALMEGASPEVKAEWESAGGLREIVKREYRDHG